MGKWLDLAREMETEGRDNSANSDNSSEAESGSDARNLPNGTNVTNVTGYVLPDIIETGLAALRDGPVPKSAHGWRPIWRQIVADALWLRVSGYGGQAMALGWDPLHLFGIAPDETSDARPGLAVWLNGSRRLVLLDERSAISREGDLRRCFNCRSTDGAVFLWDLQ